MSIADPVCVCVFLFQGTLFRVGHQFFCRLVARGIMAPVF